MQKPSLPDPPADVWVRVGRWRADPRADEIEADGEVVKLEPLKMRLLIALASRPGEVVLTQELLDTVWAGLVVTPGSVYQGIAQLRKVLGDEGYIETVPRKGYRLVAPVQRVPRAPVAVDTIPSPIETPPPPDPNRRRVLMAGGAGAALAAAGAWGVWRWIDPPVSSPVRVAVLPFSDRSAGAAEPALSTGLAMDVIRALERFPQVDVVAGESVMALGRGAGLVAEAMRRLGAGFVLQGDLDRVGSTVRVAVRLINGPGERVRWRREFERTVETVSLLPLAIANEAAAALDLGAPDERSAGPSEAYELYVLGQDAWRPKTPEAFAKARDYYQRGIALDAGYARNYLGLGWTWIGQMSNGGGIDWAEAFARATPLFDKALRLDPESAEAMTAQGVLHSHAGRYEEARRLFGEALRRHPGYAQAHHSLGVAEYDDGWPARAVSHFQRAAELNPLSLSPLDRLGVANVAAGRHDDAERAYRKAVELEPRHPNGHWGLGIAAYARGELDTAVRQYRVALDLEARRPFLWGELAWLYLDLGMPDAAAEAFARRTALLPRSPWPKVDAAFEGLLRTPPADLVLPPADDDTAVDAVFIRAMGGLPPDAAFLERALAAEQGRQAPAEPSSWFLFQGRFAPLETATLLTAAGRPDQAAPWLERAERQLDRYQRQGNVWHALHFHRARVFALRGQAGPALDALEAAVPAGHRRGWWLRRDPALAGIRGEARFRAVLASVDGFAERQRASLKSA